MVLVVQTLVPERGALQATHYMLSFTKAPNDANAQQKHIEAQNAQAEATATSRACGAACHLCVLYLAAIHTEAVKRELSNLAITQ